MTSLELKVPRGVGGDPSSGKAKARANSRGTFGGAVRRDGGGARKCDKVAPLKEMEAKVGRSDTLTVSSLSVNGERSKIDDPFCFPQYFIIRIC